MSFHDKDFWIPKCGGDLSGGEAVFDSSSRINVKRAHQLFSSAVEPELFPNKKQTVDTSLGKSTSEIAVTNSTCWETYDLPSGANQFIDRLFGVDTTRPVELIERSISPGNTGNSTMRKKVIDDQSGDDPLVGLSMSYSIEEPQICISNNRIRKVNVNQAEDSENAFHLSIGNNIYRLRNVIALHQLLIPIPEGFPNAIFGFELESDIDALARPVSGYDYLHYQSSVVTSSWIDQMLMQLISPLRHQNLGVIP